MNTIFDSILLNSLQLESSSDEATLDCTIFENGDHYNTEVVLSGTALNQLLNELSCRDIELDFENAGTEIRLPDGGTLFHMQFDNGTQPVFLPLYVLPERIRLLRA